MVQLACNPKPAPRSAARRWRNCLAQSSCSSPATGAWTGTLASPTSRKGTAAPSRESDCWRLDSRPPGSGVPSRVQAL
eukprot:10955937-Karenia_brevis.AAC.1